MSEYDRLLEPFRERKRRALARAISAVEGERPGFQPFLHRLIKGGLSTPRVGITGPPGAGKSTLVSAMAAESRRRDEDVGIVAVDPTSPFSGVARLGDRIRMHDVASDPGIFIRSMATRGSLGGLATTTKEVLDVMDAFGFSRLLVETVGVGQSELEITGATDTVAVVLVPESGDGVQAMKAGLMEIADLFVVNKSDRPGADRLVKEIRTALKLRHGDASANVPAHHGVDLRRLDQQGSSGGHQEGREDGPDEEAVPPWEVPIVQTVGQTGEGVAELLDTLDRHREHLKSSGEMERRLRARARARVEDVVRRELHRAAVRAMDEDRQLEEELGAIVEGGETPYSVARRVLEGLGAEEVEERLPDR